MERRENLQKMKEKRERPQPLYMDDDIAIIDLKECDLFGSQEGVRLDYFLFLSCISGNLRFSINAHEKELKAYQILLCRPNDLLGNFEFSTDCQGIVMCVSREAIHDNIRLDNLCWKSKLPLNENPILHLSEEEIQLLSRYGQLIDYRVRMKGRPYSKEVVVALIRAFLLELYINISARQSEQPDPYYRRKDSLFQTFMKKLTSMEVKPRSVTWYAEQL